VLDFNRPNPDRQGAELTAGFQRFYLRRLVVPAAERFGVRENYAYLEASLKQFPTGAVQQSLAELAGFSHSQHRLLAGGLMGLLELVA
jgi:demethylmenaquinone methyltransferase/2-methoxy-6-polyprenyl-1,4-benzoquinol methylase